MSKHHSDTFENQFLLRGFDGKSQQIIRNALDRLQTGSPDLYKYAQNHITAIVGSGIPGRHDAFLNPSHFSSRNVPDIVKEFYVMQTLVDNARIMEVCDQGLDPDPEELKLDSEFFALAVFDACFPLLPENTKSQVSNYRRLMEESLNNGKERLGKNQFSIATHFKLCGFDINSERNILQAIRTLECYPDLLDYVQQYVWTIILTPDRTDLKQGQCQLKPGAFILSDGVQLTRLQGNLILIFWIIADAEQHELAEEGTGIFNSLLCETFAQIHALDKLSETIIRTLSNLEWSQADWIYRVIAREIRMKMEKQVKHYMPGISILDAVCKHGNIPISPKHALEHKQIWDETNFSLETYQVLDDLIGDESMRIPPSVTDYDEIGRLLFESCSSWNGIASLWDDLKKAFGDTHT